MNNELDRRSAFWDYYKREFLDAAIRELDKRRADKWLDDVDLQAFNCINDALQKAMLLALIRYREVLSDVIEDMQIQQEAQS